VRCRKRWRSLQAKLGDVFAEPFRWIEPRQQLDRGDFQSLAEKEHLEVANPDELTLDLRYPGAIDLPPEDLKPGCKVGLLKTEIVAPLSHLRTDYILVHRAHGGTSRRLSDLEKAPIWEPNERPPFAGSAQPQPIWNPTG
jgi:hypothetical protein